MTFADEAVANAIHLRRCHKRGIRVNRVDRYRDVQPYWEIVYHGTPIVWVFPAHNAVALFHGGFKTRTTKSRMNHVLGRGSWTARQGMIPYRTRYHLYQHRFQWYVRDDVSMTTIHWKGGRFLIISPEYNAGCVTERIPSGWVYNDRAN